MKKIILAAALLVSVCSLNAKPFSTIAITANDPSQRPRTIPQPAVDAYNAMFPGATTVKWARKGENVYQVTFILNGKKDTARYASDGTYLGK